MFTINLFKAKPKIEVGAIAVMSGRKILMGKRRDKGHRWTNVGGHIEKGETPVVGAVRELKEEAGIDAKPSQLKSMGFVDVTAINGDKIRVHAFKFKYSGPTTMLDDPDKEVFRWQWFDLDAMPDHVMDNLHAKKNILLEKLKAKKIEKSLDLDIDLEKAKKLPVGHITTLKNGERVKKVKDGEWVKVQGKIPWLMQKDASDEKDARERIVSMIKKSDNKVLLVPKKFTQIKFNKRMQQAVSKLEQEGYIKKRNVDTSKIASNAYDIIKIPNEKTKFDKKISFSEKTDIPNLDDMIADPDYFKERKNREYKIEKMSPDKYIDIVAENYFNSVKGTFNAPKTVGDARKDIVSSREKNTDALKKIESYKELFIPYIKFDEDGYAGQEGLHRAMVAKKHGVKTMPVMIVFPVGKNPFSERNKKLEKRLTDALESIQKMKPSSSDAHEKNNVLGVIKGAIKSDKIEAKEKALKRVSEFKEKRAMHELKRRSVFKAFTDLFKAKKMAVGTIRTYKNGKRYQKKADGTWQEVVDKKKKKETKKDDTPSWIKRLPKSDKAIGKVLENLHGTKFYINGYDADEEVWTAVKYGDKDNKKAEVYGIDPNHKDDQKSFKISNAPKGITEKDSWHDVMPEGEDAIGITLENVHGTRLYIKEWDSKEKVFVAVKLGDKDNKKAEEFAIDPTDEHDQKSFKFYDEKETGSKKVDELEDKIIDIKGTPRGDANDGQKELDKDYEFARKSAFRNKGEDLKGSARHKRNEFRNLSDIEKAGRGAELVTRDNLLKLFPLDLMDGISPKNHEIRLTAHFIMKKFPNKAKLRYTYSDTDEAVVGRIFKHKETGEEKYFHHWSNPEQSINMKEYSMVREIQGKDHAKYEREKYYDTFMRIRSAVEKHVEALESEKAQSEYVTMTANEESGGEKKDVNFAGYDHKLLDALRTEVTATISDQRKVNRYDDQANNLINYVNKILWKHNRSSNSVNTELGKFKDYSSGVKTNKWGDETKIGEALTDDQKVDMAMSVIEGKTVDKAFGLATGKSRADEFKPASLYMGKAELEGKRTGLKTVKQQEKYILEKSGMRGLQWGNSVTDDERKHHLKFVSNSFKDLTDVLGLPEKMGSFNGKLGLAIGARGKGTALAHYEPSTKVINLTRKNGVGSLAHEWGHFFDNVVAQVSSRRGAHFSSSQGWYGVKDDHEVVKKFRTLIRDNEGMREFYDQTSDACYELKMSTKKKQYWKSDHEMFARAFEKYVYFKLEKNKKKNTYLCKDVDHKLWPTKEQVEKMTPAFDAIFDEFKNSDLLQKAIDFMSGDIVTKQYLDNAVRGLTESELADLHKEEQPYFKNKFWRYPKQQSWSSERKSDWHKNQLENHDSDTPEYKMHLSAHKRWQKKYDMEKSKFVFPDLNKRMSQGEGSRGGKIIGHTKNGRPIYQGGKDALIGKKTDNKTDNKGKEEKPKTELNQDMTFYPSQAQEVIKSFLKKYPKLNSVISGLVEKNGNNKDELLPAIAQVLASQDPVFAMSLTKAVQEEFNYDLTAGLYKVEHELIEL